MLVRKSNAVPQSESGVVLLLVMILMVVFSLLTLAMYDLLKTSTQISGNHKRDLRAIYIAEAGAEHAINLLRDDPTLADDADYTIASTSFADGAYTVTIADAGTPLTPTFFRQANITSTGTLHGLSREIVVHVKSISVGSSGNYTIATTSWKLQ